MPQNTIERSVYLLILLAYLVTGTLFALRTPDWQAPDEPPHYNYVAQVAAGDWLPVIEMGDWDNAYLEALKAADFAPELLDRFDTIQYENHQPPLYYWLAAPIYRLTDGSLTALRLYSVVLGGITVALAFAISKIIVPDQPQIALAVMALVAFLPQQMHMTASINNDALAGVMIGLLLLAILHYLQGDGVQTWHLGLLVGIIFITKTTAYFMAGVALVAVVIGWQRQSEKQIRRLFNQALGFAVPAGVFAALYWGRNLMVYGMPDFLGLKHHDTIVIGQLRTAELIDRIGFGAYLRKGLETTFHSFWGQFGWMEARLADAIPAVGWLLALLMVLGLAGLLLMAFQARQHPENSGQRSTVLILCLVLLLAVLQFIYYNLTFVQFQGRYIFTGIIPFSLGIVTGFDVWRKLLTGRIHHSAWLTTAVFITLAPLDMYLIWRVIPGAVGGI